MGRSDSALFARPKRWAPLFAHGSNDAAQAPGPRRRDDPKRRSGVASGGIGDVSARLARGGVRSERLTPRAKRAHPYRALGPVHAAERQARGTPGRRSRLSKARGLLSFHRCFRPPKSENWRGLRETFPPKWTAAPLGAALLAQRRAAIASPAYLMIDSERPRTGRRRVTP